MLLPLAY